MKNGINFLSLWFGIIMVVIVLAGAIAFTFTNFLEDRLYGTKRTVMIVIFFAYAVYRGIRIYQFFKTKEND